MARKLPAHIPGSIRAWRAKKRRELRAVDQALWKLASGSSYTPASGEISQMLGLLIDARQKLRGEWEP